MRRFLTHAAALTATLTLALTAQAGNHGGNSSHSSSHSSQHMSSSRMSGDRSHSMMPSSHSFQHQSSYHSMNSHGKSYTKFTASKNFHYERFGRHSLSYTHKYWSSKYHCWCCWAPSYNCWYFYEPCYQVYVPVTYLPQVYCQPAPVAAPEPSYAASAPVAPASVIQQTTVNTGAPAVAPPPPPVGAF